MVELGEFEHDCGGLADLLALESHFEGDFVGLVGLEADLGVDGLFDDCVWGVVCDLFDFDAAFAGGDEGVAAGVAVGGDGEVVLVGGVWGAVGDVDTCGDEEGVDFEAFGAGLGGDHFVGEHEVRGGGGFGG